MSQGTEEQKDEQKDQQPPRLPWRVFPVCGRRFSGKSTLVELVKKALGDTYVNVHEAAVAEPLKRGVQALFRLSDEQLHDPEKKEAIDPDLGVSPRDLFQVIGTEWLRDRLKSDLGVQFRREKDTLWSYHLRKRVRAALDDDPTCVVFVPDVRFVDELDVLREFPECGPVLHVVRSSQRSSAPRRQHAVAPPSTAREVPWWTPLLRFASLSLFVATVGPRWKYEPELLAFVFAVAVALVTVRLHNHRHGTTAPAASRAETVVHTFGIVACAASALWPARRVRLLLPSVAAWAAATIVFAVRRIIARARANTARERDVSAHASEQPDTVVRHARNLGANVVTVYNDGQLADLATMVRKRLLPTLGLLRG